jgi:hypothetical protein
MALADRPSMIKWQSGLSPDILQGIGMLAVVSGKIEQLLHLIYWRHAGLTDKTGPIVTSDLSPNRLTEAITKLVKLDPAKAHIAADLGTLFTEFRLVNKQRNQYIHWIWSIQGRTPETEPEPPYKVLRPLYKQSGDESAEFDAEQVTQLCNDCAWLEARLSAHAMDESALRARRTEIDQMGAITSPVGLRLSDLFLPAPWLDKPLPPSPTHEQNPAIQK